MSAMIYEIRDPSGAVVNTIIADPDFVEAVFPGLYTLIGTATGPLSFEQRKSDKDAAARAKRWEIETGGVEFAGTIIRSDEGSQSRITGAVSLLDKDPTLTFVDWEAQPKVWVTIDKATMTAIGIAVGRHVQACFSRFRVLSEAIDAAADDAALDAIDITAGWPT